jgi:hypothetical protein
MIRDRVSPPSSGSRTLSFIWDRLIGDDYPFEYTLDSDDEIAVFVTGYYGAFGWAGVFTVEVTLAMWR